MTENALQMSLTATRAQKSLAESSQQNSYVNDFHTEKRKLLKSFWIINAPTFPEGFRVKQS